MIAALAHRLDGTLVDHTPELAQWAAWFTRYPDEFARLVELDRQAGRPPLSDLPSGDRSTALGYARYFADRPTELAALAAPLLVPTPEPEIRRGADGRRIY